MRKFRITLIPIAILAFFVTFNIFIGHNSVSPKYKGEVCHVEVDYSFGSGKPRFFVYEHEKCLDKSLCAHGKGPGNTASKPRFSNEIGSGCSSLGTFEIIGRSVMSNGYPCLVLRGLDNINSKAYERHIYVHPSKLVDCFKFGIYPFVFLLLMLVSVVLPYRPNVSILWTVYTGLTKVLGSMPTNNQWFLWCVG